jgi:hypothetical protein
VSSLDAVKENNAEPVSLFFEVGTSLVEVPGKLP